MADYGPVPSAAARATTPGGGAEGDGVNRSLENRRFATLDNYLSATRQDSHSVLVDYDIFVNVPRLDAQDSKTVQRVYRAEDFDFRLEAGSGAIDRGLALPNITDGFAGQAPDLGAVESGQSLPHYGPRAAANPPR